MHAEIRELVGQVLAAQISGTPLTASHYFLCAKCAQAIDARSVAQIFHHLLPEHECLSDAELTELCPFEFTRRASQILMRVRSGLSAVDIQQEN